MANPKHKLDREDLMAFLLGELEEAEQSRIESMFLKDETLRDELESVKSDLFVAYQSGRLNERRSGALKKRFLPESIEKDREEFREMLAQNEAERAREARGEELPPGTGGGARAASAASQPVAPVAPAARAGKTSRLVPILLGATLLIAGVVAAVLVLGGTTSTASSARPEVTLRPYSVRGKSQLIALPDGPEVVLRLPHTHAGSFASYGVRRFFVSESEELASTVIDGVVTVTVTRDTLQEGRYDLELRGIQDDGAIEILGYYSFHK